MPRWTKQRRTRCLTEPLPCQSSSNGSRLSSSSSSRVRIDSLRRDLISLCRVKLKVVIILLPILDPSFNPCHITLNIIHLITLKLYHNFLIV